jgi:hypothetical protein
MHRSITWSPTIALAVGTLSAGVFSLALQPPTATGQPAAAQGATLFEGARLIAGTGGPAIENAAFLVEGARFVQVGRAGELRAPAGVTRVSLAGKTVMPAVVDTHMHMAGTRDALLDQLRGKAYFGVGAVMSLGQDAGDLPFQIRADIIPGAALFRTAGRGITICGCRSRRASTKALAATARSCFRSSC